ncbi:DUF1471 domain-containing protein [Sphingomonas sp. 1P08PE]|uniref:DUF1471 domain-containing protein n=1 Tax=Sphingomonas sp. 1P08PE TaxID=554122 RepID=UPI0039A0AB83
MSFSDRHLYAFVHERWDTLPDTRLVAATDSFYSADELAKALARRADAKQSYVITDLLTGKQDTWTRARVDERDNPTVGAEA